MTAERERAIGDCVLYQGDCFDVLRGMDADSVDSIVTDPPYGLSFMGKAWDHQVPSSEMWAEAMRVLKPGGHLLAFAGTRTQHRMAVSIEDAGFEIRDMIAWVYGSGFPKSQNVSKMMDKAAGAEREVVGKTRASIQRNGTGDAWAAGAFASHPEHTKQVDITAPATHEARQWDGWGTALKPALEPITVARKPLIGTVAANVLEHGTGAVNVDGCRVGTSKNVPHSPRKANSDGSSYEFGAQSADMGGFNADQGRWPANLIHDGSDEVTGLFPVTGGDSPNRKPRTNKGLGNTCYGDFATVESPNSTRTDKGSAARFFYTAKASKRDRTEGGEVENRHPTVKPTDLMRYLCRLVTPPGGIVLDPFMGSGSTGKAAVAEGFAFRGIERDEESFDTATARFEAANRKPHQQDFDL